MKDEVKILYERYYPFIILLIFDLYFRNVMFFFSEKGKVGRSEAEETFRIIRFCTNRFKHP